MDLNLRINARLWSLKIRFYKRADAVFRLESTIRRMRRPTQASEATATPIPTNMAIFGTTTVDVLMKL